MPRKIAFTGNTVLSQVKGGTIEHDADSGRLVEVTWAKTRIKPSKGSSASIAVTSSKRSAALKRLVNR